MHEILDEHVRSIQVKTLAGDMSLNLQYTYFIDSANILYSWAQDEPIRAVGMFNRMKYEQYNILEVYPLALTNKKREGITRFMNSRGITVDDDVSWMTRR